jgi:hypothetical protein
VQPVVLRGRLTNDRGGEFFSPPPSFSAQEDINVRYWYRQVGPTSWVLYDGNQAIWEATTRGELLAWCRERGIEAEWLPLRVVVIR